MAPFIVSTDPTTGAVTDSNGTRWENASIFYMNNPGSATVIQPSTSPTPIAAPPGANPQFTIPLNATQAIDPATMAMMKQAYDNEAAGNWSNLMGYVIATGQLPPVNAPTLNAQEAMGLIGPDKVPSTTEQQLMGLGANGNPTLQALQQYADITGLTPTGMPGSPAGSGGTPTFAAQQAQGFVGGLPTTTEQQVASQQIAAILAANNPATPFTYLSKLNNINQLGDTSSILRNAMQAITGYDTSQLAQQPTVSQASLLSSLFGNMSAGPNGTNTNLAQTAPVQTNTIPAVQPSSGTDLQHLMAYLHQSKPGTADTAMNSGSSSDLATLMSYLHNSKPTATPTYDSNGRITAWTPLQTGSGQSANPLSQALPNLANMSNTQNPSGLSSNILSGYGLSGQQLNKMAPTAQSAILDYIQSQGGANPTDAMAVAKRGMPEFSKAANGTIGQMSNL